MIFKATLFSTVFFLFISEYSSGQSVIAEKISKSEIVGSYSNGFLKIKGNHHFKARYPAPRPMVCKGTWEIHKDTLYLYLTHRNVALNGDSKNVKGKPIEMRCIVSQGRLYSVRVENNQSLVIYPLKKD
jgi:hypothetical protein